MILSGQPIAQDIYTRLAHLAEKSNTQPYGAVIVVGENPDLLRYVQQKQKWAASIGFHFEKIHLPESVSQWALIDTIQKLNINPDIHGYILQLPLPKHLDVQRILPYIDPKKDIDGFCPVNQGKIVLGYTDGFQACTPKGIMKLFEYYDISLLGKDITVIGRSMIVGKPLSHLLTNAWATVTLCHSHTKNISFFTKNADIVIIAIGQPHFLKKEMLKKNAVVIDVGFCVRDGKIFWDADFENISPLWHDITPVPGGVGPLTVACLLENLREAFQKKEESR